MERLPAAVWSAYEKYVNLKIRTASQREFRRIKGITMKTQKMCTITGIDHEHNTIYLSVNGMTVTAICSKEPSPKAYTAIQSILIDTILKANIPAT